MEIIFAVFSWLIVLAWFTKIARKASKFYLAGDRRRFLSNSAKVGMGIWIVSALILYSPLLNLLPIFLWPFLAPFTMTLYPVSSLLNYLGNMMGYQPPFPAYTFIPTGLAVILAIILWLPLLWVRQPRVPIFLAVVIFCMIWLSTLAWYFYSLFG